MFDIDFSRWREKSVQGEGSESWSVGDYVGAGLTTISLIVPR